MNQQTLSSHVGRAKYELAECMNRGGEAFYALFRLIIVLCMLLLLSIAKFLNLLDEQLEPSTKEVQNQWQHNL